MLNLLKKNSFSSEGDQNKVFRKNDGFTLIEALLAIGILSVVAVQMIAVQGTSLVVAQNTFKNVTATWALKSAESQLEYVLDSLGADGLTPEVSVVPVSAPDFKVTIIKKEADLEASKLIGSVMKLGKSFGQGGGAAAESPDADASKEEESQPAGMKEMSAMLDSQIPKDLFKTVQILVEWPDGAGKKSIEGGVLYIKPHSIEIPNIPGMGGGGGAEEGGGPGGTPTRGPGTSPTATSTRGP